MANSAAETVIGAAVLVVAGGFLAYAARTADVDVGGAYELTASFRKADGVTIGGDVRISGVKVGSIREIALDSQTYRANVVVSIREGVQVPEDSAATIASDGLLGGAHVAIQPGGSEFMLEPGDSFEFTQGSVNILDLVGRAIGGGGGE
jgi:phospholipid/cholesterol/gamma-HCH transport system substrate-binding protein